MWEWGTRDRRDTVVPQGSVEGGAGNGARPRRWDGLRRQRNLVRGRERAGGERVDGRRCRRSESERRRGDEVDGNVRRDASHFARATRVRIGAAGDGGKRSAGLRGVLRPAAAGAHRVVVRGASAARFGRGFLAARCPEACQVQRTERRTGREHHVRQREQHGGGARRAAGAQCEEWDHGWGIRRSQLSGQRGPRAATERSRYLARAPLPSGNPDYFAGSAGGRLCSPLPLRFGGCGTGSGSSSPIRPRTRTATSQRFARGL